MRDRGLCLLVLWIVIRSGAPRRWKRCVPRLGSGNRNPSDTMASWEGFRGCHMCVTAARQLWAVIHAWLGPVREGPGPILPFGEDTCLAKIRWRPWQSVIPMLLGDHARRKLTEARAANAEEIAKGIAEEEE